MKLYYISNSWANSVGANAIQTSRMCDAFSALGYTVEKFVRNKERKAEVHSKYNVQNIYANRSKIWSIIYLFKVVFIIVKKIDKGDVIYSRNIGASILLSFLLPRFANNILEVHEIPRSAVKRVLFKFLGNLKFVICISETIAEELRSSYKFKHVHVLHDAHANPYTTSIQIPKQNKRPYNFAYAGGLRKQKGLDYLLALEKHSDVNLTIYTYENTEAKTYFQNYLNVPNSQIFEELIQYDGLILFNVDDGKDESIFKYTSPLKLFEYMSVGTPIIANNTPSYESVLSEIKYIDAPIEDPEWIEKVLTELDILMSKQSDLECMVRNNISVSKKYTYKERGKKIMELLSDG